MEKHLYMTIIALTACITTTARANSTHDVNMSRTKGPIVISDRGVNLTQEDIDRFWSKVDKNGPLPDQSKPYYAGIGKCWIWTACTFAKKDGSNAYGSFTLNGRTYYAHRLSFFMENGHFPKKGQACHRCDVEKCVNPDHIFDGTLQDNLRDRDLKGRTNRTSISLWSKNNPELRPRGEQHGRVKISEGNVLEILDLGKNGDFSHREIASRFSVSRETVGQILRGERWKHINRNE